jgi:hypothetical protein
MARFIDRKVQEFAASSPRPILRISTQYRTKSKDVLGQDAYREIRPGETWCKSATKAVFVDGKRTGQAITVCADSKCKEHFLDGYGGPQYTAAERAKRRAEAQKRKIDLATRARVAAASVERIAGPLTGRPLQAVAAALVRRLHHEAGKWLCQSLGLEPTKHSWGGWNHDAPVLAQIPELSDVELYRLIACCAIGDEVTLYNSSGGRRDDLALARALKVNPDVIERAVRAELSAKRTKKSAARPKQKVQTSTKRR